MLFQEIELVKEEPEVVEKSATPPPVDPFEFQEDPVIFEPATKPSISTGKQDPKQYIPHYQQQPAPPQPPPPQPASPMETVTIKTEETVTVAEIKQEMEIKEEVIEDQPKVDKSIVPGSVEIVEVVVMDEEDIDKELNKSQIQNIVHSSKSEEPEDVKPVKIELVEEKPEEEIEETNTPESKEVITCEESSEASDITTITITKKDISINLDVQDSAETTTITHDFTEALYDDINMEVKIDKSGKVKRDYSRTKKKEGKLTFLQKISRPLNIFQMIFLYLKQIPHFI